eukprot:TRINITY_DN21559_c0_g1_i1.p1 TRINITY_DN21559_c0_g1~~TRINITY_DN21559_c0_g1_i1.p1  ORF type:complete len:393 (+),score=103.41 TRINITY_DN21559_c0_g1_i1:78-1256(+)
MADWEDNEAVVIDNGSGMMKAGLAGREAPDAVFPAVVGRPRKGASGDVLVGEDAVDAKGYRLRYPVSHGIVTDWDDMELVWRHAYKELDVDPRERACLVTEAPMNPKRNREKMLELLFEKFEVPALYVQIQAVLSLYECGRSEGVVVDSGDGISHTVPVYDGRVVSGAVQRMEVAGRDLTEWMVELLNADQERRFTTSADREIAKAIKEKYCYLESDFDAAHAKWDEDNTAFDEVVTHEDIAALPDGETVTVGRARFACPEALFEPALMDRECKGIHRVLYDCISKVGLDCRKTMWSNILLSGGTTLIKGLEERLEKEAYGLAPPGAKDCVKVVSDSSSEGRGVRRYCVWMGGSIMANLSAFQDQWVQRSEYEEMGPSIVHRRCEALSGFRD